MNINEYFEFKLLDTNWLRYPAHPQLNLDTYLKLDIGQIAKYNLIQSVNFKGII